MKVLVVGLGYVGTPVAATLAGAGHDVVGVDIDSAKVEAINTGKSPLLTEEPDLDVLLQEGPQEGTLRATTDYDEGGRGRARLCRHPRRSRHQAAGFQSP